MVPKEQVNTEATRDDEVEAEAPATAAQFETDLLMTIDAPALALDLDSAADDAVPNMDEAVSSNQPAAEVTVATCHAIVARTGKACTLKAKANGRCGRHKAEKFAQ